ncbi:hypothetical protein PJL15_03554 [Paenarthrobacter nitroguajacolicus]|nr:hypothetical protein [Paenarthrobacter nitroguajacolicus]
MPTLCGLMVAGTTMTARIPMPLAAGIDKGTANASMRITRSPRQAHMTNTIPAFGATGALSETTVSAARLIRRPTAVKVPLVGMKPARLSWRQNVKLSTAARDTKDPRVASKGWVRIARSPASVKETTRTVVINGMNQAQPRRTPFSDNAAPRTATAMEPAMTQG